jgi:hypothetical protein
MTLLTLTKPMLNRLTLPQLRAIADQMGVTYTDLSEKEWIVSDILEGQDDSIPTTTIHDALLRLERSTEDPAIASARQLVKEYCFAHGNSKEGAWL